MKIVTCAIASLALVLTSGAMARKAGQTRDEAMAISARKFRKIDANGDGKGSPTEYQTYTAKVAEKKGSRVDQAKIDRRFKRIDTDGDGLVTAAETLAYDMARFDKTDANGNGVIDATEGS